MKRLFDILVAGLLLTALLPLIVAVALLVWIKLGRPVIFKQRRPGFHGKPFTLFKFRTMVNRTGPNGILLPDCERLTSFGAFLRGWSLDELPELWNVLRGDMSLVGPRPLLMDYTALYTPQQARRHDVYPGLTGWAQVNGRNAQSWEDRFMLDVWYVDNHDFRLDMKILWLTVKSVMKRHGISADGEATMPRFTGTRSE